MKITNIVITLLIIISAFLFITFHSGFINAQNNDCFYPDVKFKLNISSLVKGDNYSLEVLRIQIASDTEFKNRFEDKLKSEGVEKTPEGLKPADETFTIYLSGKEGCQYYIRAITIDGKVFESTNMTPFIPTGKVVIDVKGIPEVSTNSTKITATVEGENITKYKYRINNGEWIEKDISENTLKLTFGYGSQTIEFIGLNRYGDESELWTRTFKVEGSLFINVNGIPEGNTNSTKITATVEGGGIITYKYRINKGEWIEKNISDNILKLTFGYGLQTVEFIGFSENGDKTELWTRTFEVERKSVDTGYPIYLGGYGYEVMLNWYYYVAISHYKKSRELYKEGKEEEAFEAEKLAYAYYRWANKVEDSISINYDYKLPSTEPIIEIEINNRTFNYTEPLRYELLRILEDLIETYLNAGYRSMYQGKLDSAMDYFEIVVLLDPYNEYALRELKKMFGTSYKPNYASIFTEEVDPR